MKEPAPQISSYDYDAINSVVDGVDACARQYEDKWGVGRLELLVSDELREKFRRQLERFNQAVVTHDVVKVRLAGAGLKRGWEVLDQAATEVGAKPLDPEVWELPMPDGRVIAFCRHVYDSTEAWRSGRYLEVWTPEEIIRLVDKYPAIVLSKSTFPGAYVQAVRAKRPPDVSEMEIEIYEDNGDE